MMSRHVAVEDAMNVLVDELKDKLKQIHEIASKHDPPLFRLRDSEIRQIKELSKAE
jgi:hypothetical protein